MISHAVKDQGSYSNRIPYYIEWAREKCTEHQFASLKGSKMGKPPSTAAGNMQSSCLLQPPLLMSLFEEKSDNCIRLSNKASRQQGKDSTTGSLERTAERRTKYTLNGLDFGEPRLRDTFGEEVKATAI